MYNILNYGAIADGKTINTAAIQKAIDDCHANGGGTVLVPAGEFMTGTIWLRSNVELHLEHASKLIASHDLNDYNNNDDYEQNWFSMVEQWNGKHLIIVHECENVAITGHGEINGSGDVFFGETRFLAHYVWEDGIREAKDKVNLRPGQLIVFIECQHVKVTDITVRNSPCWSLLFHGCDYVQVRGYKAFNGHIDGNTDGIDIDACSFVTVSDCIIDTGDDAIAVRCVPSRLKNKNKICEYVTISNCTLSAYSAGVRLGVGNGLIRHVNLSNLVFKHTGSCFNLSLSYSGKSVSHLENIMISNITCAYSNRFIKTVGKSGTVKNFVMDNIYANTMSETQLIAPSEDGFVENIKLSNINMHFKNKPIELTEEVIKERGDNMFIAKGIKGLEMRNICLTVEPGEESTWNEKYIIEDCEDAIIENCR